EIGLGLASLLHTSAWPVSCCISTPPCSAAHGTWFCALAELYSAWNVNLVPLQVLTLVCMNPFLALAVMKPLWPVVMSSMVMVNPAFGPVSGSVIATRSTSPSWICSVWAFGVSVWKFVSCGLGGPAGLPLRWMYAKFTGSGQFGLMSPKPKCDA